MSTNVINASPVKGKSMRTNWCHPLLPFQVGGWEGDGTTLTVFRRLSPIPTPALPLKGREKLGMRLPLFTGPRHLELTGQCSRMVTNVIHSSPFKGEAGRGMELH